MGAEAPERLIWLPVISRERARTRSKDAAPRKLTVVNDADLLARAQVGDSDAVAALFDRYSRLVLGIGFRILHDRGEAEDLLQEVFLRLCQKEPTFDASKGSARTWMFQFAYRRALDRRSYLMRRRFYDGTELGQLTNALEESINFEEQMTARVTGEQLHAAFETLNPKQRATLELFFFGDCDLREVAERLGETIANTRHHYYRGLQHLKRTATAPVPCHER